MQGIPERTARHGRSEGVRGGTSSGRSGGGVPGTLEVPGQTPLTDRDRHILQLVAGHRALTTEQLTVLAPG